MAPAPRARDRLGRPVPDDDADRADHGVDVDLLRSPSEALSAAQALLEAGFPFAAHEVFETRWKHCPADERDLWQGLAQWCVALTHRERGNVVGAERLRVRALEHLNAPAARSAAQRLTLPLGSVTAWLADPSLPLPNVTSGSAGDVSDES